MLWFLAEIPFIGYILSFLLTILATFFGVTVLNWVKVDLVQLLLLGLGVYILLYIVREVFPEFIKKGRKKKYDSYIILYLTIFSMILIFLGAPNVIFSMLGGVKYSVIIP